MHFPMSCQLEMLSLFKLIIIVLYCMFLINTFLHCPVSYVMIEHLLIASFAWLNNYTFGAVSQQIGLEVMEAHILG